MLPRIVRLFAVLVSLASPFAAVADEQIEVSLKILESDAKIPHDLARIVEEQKVKLLSAPRITTRPGQSAKIETGGDPQAGLNQPAETGYEIAVTPTLEDDRIGYSGWATLRRPVGDPLKMRLQGRAGSGQAVWFDLPTGAGEKKCSICLVFKVNKD